MLVNSPTDSIDAYGGLGVSLDTSDAPFDSFLSKGLIHGYSSSRKLVSTAGDAIRVRRDSDSAEEDIGFSSGELDTGNLTSFISTNSGFVRTIYDQVGSTNAEKSVTTNQHRIVNSGTIDTFNSKPMQLRVAGAFNDYYITSNITVTNYTIFVVAGKRAAAGLCIFLSNAGTSHAYFTRPGTGQLNNRVSTTAIQEHTVMNTDQLYSFCLIKNSSTEDNVFYRDNSLVGTVNLTQGDPTWTGIFGADNNLAFAELLIFNEVLSETDRNTVNENIDTFYGI